MSQVKGFVKSLEEREGWFMFPDSANIGNEDCYVRFDLPEGPPGRLTRREFALEPLGWRKSVAKAL